MHDQGTAKTPKGYKGLAMEGVIAKLFARTRKRSMEELKSWANMINAEVSDESTVLEVAPGPGYLAIELARLGNCKITGLDISKTFVEIAQKNANEAGVNIDFRQGDAGHMPFGNDIFDFIVCTTAFKDFAEPVNALNEMHRVLRPTGYYLASYAKGLKSKYPATKVLLIARTPTKAMVDFLLNRGWDDIFDVSNLDRFISVVGAR